MIELIAAAFVGGVIGAFIARNTWRFTEWKMKREWEKAGKRWSQTYERATEAGEYFGDLPPDDDLVVDIRERVKQIDAEESA